jgi:diguanylate cyclase (GGDEF)-like protein
MSQPPTPSQQTKTMLAAVWNKNRELLLHRMDAIETFCRRLPPAGDEDQTRALAYADAHKLAGSLGMFGLAEGTLLAREIEQRLKGNAPDELLAADLPALAGRLRQLIESFHINEEIPAPTRRHRLLILESDAEVAGGLFAAAEKRGIEPRVAPDLAAARQALQAEAFDVLILDLGMAESYSAAGDDYAEQVRDLVLSRASMQVLALTSVDSFEDRVTAAQIGAHGFLPKTAPVSEIVDTCEHLLDLKSAQFKVLIVDDDPSVLSAVKVLLDQFSIHVTSLADPRLFWNVLGETVPDLVILDLEMPNFSGLALCRAIRDDKQWNRLPVLFLSASSDAQIVTSIFSAGADDFVAKPIIDIELTTRVRNRLDRDRLYRNLSDYDPLTNVRNRRSSNVVIANYLRLAERHGLPLSLVIVDLDKFKRVNDTYGHQVGDDVLVYLSGLLRQSFRSEDVVARWGGEEFVIAMFAMRRADATERMAKVLERLEDHEFEPTPGNRFRVSFSAGLAEFPDDGKDLHSLYRLADEALYRAKAAGGRRIYSVTSGVPGSRSQTDVAIVSHDVTVSAPLRHLLEMRGYSVELYQKAQDAVHELTGDTPTVHPSVILVDELPADATPDLVRRLRDSASVPQPVIFLLTSAEPANPADPALHDLERMAKPYKTSWLTQRLRRVLAR